MPFTKQKNQDFYIKDKRIFLTDSYKNKFATKFKKITGSRFYNVLGLNELSSSFKTWCMMVNIYQEPMDEMLANAGNIIEPKVRTWVEQHTNQKYLVYDPKQCQYDVFSDNKIFGGIPDGEPLHNGKIDYSNAPMLEIKTSSIDNFLYKNIDHVFVLQKDENNHPIVKSIGTKRQKWFNADNEVVIPPEYLFQLGLYCYLRNVTKGLFAICFLTKEDYINPSACDVNQREIQLVNFDVDLMEFKQWIIKAEEWYHQHIISGISPIMNEADEQLVNDLLN